MPYYGTLYGTGDSVWPFWVRHATTGTSATTLSVWPRWVTTATGSATSLAGVTTADLVWGYWVEDSVTSWHYPPRIRTVRVHDTDPIPQDTRELIASRQREHEAAIAAAEELLREHLDPVQLQSYESLQHFLVNAPSGRTYRIRKGISGNVDVLDKHGDIAGRYCIHPDISVPPQDNMLAQKLFIEHDEPAFRRIGNYTPRREIIGAAA